MERVRVEIKSKDEFWGRAFHVEWEYQFPDRKLVREEEGQYAAERDWLDDLDRVAAETFCRVVQSPENPRRRQWMSSLIPRRD